VDALTYGQATVQACHIGELRLNGDKTSSVMYLFTSTVDIMLQGREIEGAKPTVSQMIDVK